MPIYTDSTTPRTAPGSAAGATAQQAEDQARIFGTPAPAATYSRLPTATPAVTTPTITPTPAVNAAPPVFNETNSRNQAISAREGTFSAINDLFAGRIKAMTDEQNKLGEKDLARANTISAMTGMAGGVDATSRAGGVERKTAEIIRKNTDQINNEKAMALSGVFDKIDANVQREKEIALQNDQKAREQMVTDMNKSATANIMDFASHGVDWNTAYQSEDFKNEVKRSGKDVFTLQKEYEVSRAAKNATQTNFTTKVEGNKVIASWVDYDPKTGKYTPKFETSDIPGLTSPMKNSHYDAATGKLILWDDNGNSKVTSFTGSGTNAKPVAGAPKGVDTSAIEEGRQRLTTIGADGGYANPYLYRDMFDLWVQNGGARDTFIKSYPPKQYLNPAHNTLKDSAGDYVLPEYLRTTPTKSTNTVARPTFGS